MKLVKEEQLDQHIRNEHEYRFEILEDGLYAIEISARAKNWLQNTLRFISFFQDDDLAVEIDGRTFPKLNGSRGLFNGEAAWNGNQLAGLRKVVVFVNHFNAGNHVLRFHARHSPKLEAIKIHREASGQELVFDKAKFDSVEQGNRRPWLCFVFIDRAVKDITVHASAGKSRGDDDDLQLRIDGERQINNTPKSHTYWYWCGRVLNGQTRTVKQEINLSADLHYIELWADNSPTLKSVEFNFDKDAAGTGVQIRPYQYKGINGKEDYNRYDALIVDAVEYWNNEFANDTDPPKELLDPNLVKAIAFQETRVGNDARNNGLINIMQVGNPGDASLKTLCGELPEYWIHNGKQIQLRYKNARIESVKDSIHWGVRWLYHKTQENIKGHRIWHEWRTAVHRYGPGREEYAENVWRIYTKGVKKEKNGAAITLWTIATILVIAASFFMRQTTTDSVQAAVLQSFHTSSRPADDVEVQFSPRDENLFFAILEEDVDWWEGLYVGRLTNKKIQWLTLSQPPTEQSILSARFLTLEGFSDPILEVYGQTHHGHGNLYLYRIKKEELVLIFQTAAVDTYNEYVWRPDGYPKYGYQTCGFVYKNGRLAAKYRDQNSDGIADVILMGVREALCEYIVSIDQSSNIATTQTVKVEEQPIHQIYFLHSGKHIPL